VVTDTAQQFYIELKPITQAYVPAALAVSGLDRDVLMRDGVEPAVALQHFADWVHGVTGTPHTPVFVAFNAPFDWMFVHWYFVHFGVDNPFGVSAFDIKAYAMGKLALAQWADTSRSRLSTRVTHGQALTHNALDDAIVQAQTLRAINEQPLK
jgi:DNA polymerase III epsilon subunit-like protein